MTVREGSDQELRSMMYGVDVALDATDPRVDRALRLMRGPEGEKGSNVELLVVNETDGDRAERHKAALREAAGRVCEVMTAARRDGLVLSWSAGWDVSGRAFVQSVDAVKPL